jgi:hypothetical protein
MKGIFKYPDFSSTDYVDPEWIGSTGATKTGFARRVYEVCDGTYRDWTNPTTPDLSSGGQSAIRAAISKFHRRYEWANSAVTTTRYGMYWNPLIVSDLALHGAVAARYTYNSNGIMYLQSDTPHGFYDGQRMTVTGFTGSATGYNNNSYRIKKINNYTWQLATNSDLTTVLGNASGGTLTAGNSYAGLKFMDEISDLFGSDSAISNDKTTIAVTDPRYGAGFSGTIKPSILIFTLTSGQYEHTATIPASGNFDVTAATSGDFNNYWNQFGMGGVKIASGGTRLFATAYNTSTKTAYLGQWVLSAGTWSLNNTWTYTQTDGNVRFAINTAGDRLFIAKSGQNGISNSALFEIHTRSGSTWTARHSIDPGYSSRVGVAVCAGTDGSGTNGQQIVLESNGRLKFVNTGDGWVTKTESTWRSFTGTVYYKDYLNDQFAAWSDGTDIRVAIVREYTTRIPTFYNYRLSTGTLTTTNTFSGYNFEYFLRYNSTGDRVVASRFERTNPTEYDTRVQIWGFNGTNWNTYENWWPYIETEQQYNWYSRIKVRDVSDDLTMVIASNNNTKRARLGHVLIAQHVSGATEIQRQIPAVDATLAGSWITENITLTPSSTEPYKYKAVNVSLIMPGNLQYGYHDYFKSTDTWTPGARIINEYYWRPIAGYETESTGYAVAEYDWDTSGEAIPRLSVTMNTSYHPASVELDPAFPGKFTADHGGACYNITNQYNRGGVPEGYSDAGAIANEETFDTESEWDDASYTGDNKVWPSHVLPRSMKITHSAPTVTTRSQNGIKYVRDLAYKKTVLEVEYPPMTQADFDDFYTTILKVRGGKIPFFFRLQGSDGANNIWAYKGTWGTNNVGIYTAEPIAAGERTALIEGFTSRFETPIPAGSMMLGLPSPATSGGAVFALNEVDANIYGEVQVKMDYAASYNANPGSRVYLNAYWVVCTLADDNIDFAVGDSRYTGFTVRFELDEFK